MPETATTEIEFFVAVRVEQDGDLWSAYCDGLKLASSGATEAEAKRNLKATLEAFARALRERGILEDMLKNAEIRWQAIEIEGVRVIA